MEEVIFEEFKNENGFITIFDEDGLITIQMSKDSVDKIINVFDKYIKNRIEHNESIVVTEFNNELKLDFSLKNEEGGFYLVATYNNNLYHSFELEYCDMKSWEIVKKLCL